MFYTSKIVKTLLKRSFFSIKKKFLFLSNHLHLFYSTLFFLSFSISFTLSIILLPPPNTKTHIHRHVSSLLFFPVSFIANHLWFDFLFITSLVPQEFTSFSTCCLLPPNLHTAKKQSTEFRPDNALLSVFDVFSPSATKTLNKNNKIIIHWFFFFINYSLAHFPI